MRSALLLLALAIAPLGLAGCDSSSEGTPSGSSLRYALVLERDGGPVATGQLTLSTLPRPGPTSIPGTFTLESATGGPFSPLSQTTGTVDGSYIAGTLVLRLTVPQTSDVGIRLRGSLGADYRGDWDQITIAGPELQGNFAATPISS